MRGNVERQRKLFLHYGGLAENELKFKEHEGNFGVGVSMLVLWLLFTIKRQLLYVRSIFLHLIDGKYRSANAPFIFHSCAIDPRFRMAEVDAVKHNC